MFRVYYTGIAPFKYRWLDHFAKNCFNTQIGTEKIKEQKMGLPMLHNVMWVIDNDRLFPQLKNSNEYKS